MTSLLARATERPPAGCHRGTTRLAARTRLATAWQARRWSRRVESWDHHGTSAIAPVVQEVLRETCVPGTERVLDIGSGTGALAIPLATRGIDVVAVDVSDRMTAALSERAQEARLAGITAVAAPAESLAFPDASFDAVVSNYALHHLRDPDKRRVVEAAYGWLRPGGKLVIGDMMLGRGASGRDRRIIAAKLAALARKGPGGVWRIVKNVVRYTLRIQERPITPERWKGLLGEQGFEDVTIEPVVAEAAVVSGTKPT